MSWVHFVAFGTVSRGYGREDRKLVIVCYIPYNFNDIGLLTLVLLTFKRLRARGILNGVSHELLRKIFSS